MARADVTLFRGPFSLRFSSLYLTHIPARQTAIPIIETKMVIMTIGLEWSVSDQRKEGSASVMVVREGIDKAVRMYGR
jgi:hypothetical protein